jgi:type II secretory pathway component PulC
MTASAYKEVAMKMLFSADRNPTVILDPVIPPKPKPVPAFPAAHGVMMFGDLPPTVILSKKGSADQKAYQAGEKIGDFLIATISNDEVVFEWDGKQFPKKIDDLIETSAPPPPAAPASQAGPANGATPANTALGSAPDKNALAPSKTGPGKSMGSDLKACQEGDTAPAGTVADGMKKVVSETPFGKVCRWEKQ